MVNSSSNIKLGDNRDDNIKNFLKNENLLMTSQRDDLSEHIVNVKSSNNSILHKNTGKYSF